MPISQNISDRDYPHCLGIGTGSIRMEESLHRSGAQKGHYMFLFKSSLHVFVILYFPFLLKTNLLKQKSKKGLLRRSGVLEHTSMMASIIDKGSIKQRSVVITLIDLKNAFGEVHHNLIKEVLNHPHVPPSIQILISNRYENFPTAIITDNFTSPAIPVGRGVLQGDSLRSLFSTYALIHLCNSLSKRNTSNSVSLHMILLIVSLTLFIDSNSQMMQRSLQLTSTKINSF